MANRFTSSWWGKLISRLSRWCNSRCPVAVVITCLTIVMTAFSVQTSAM